MTQAPKQTEPWLGVDGHLFQARMNREYYMALCYNKPTSNGTTADWIETHLGGHREEFLRRAYMHVRLARITRLRNKYVHKAN